MAQPRNSDGTFAGKDKKLKNIFDEIQQVLDGTRRDLRHRITNEISIYSYEWFLKNVKTLSRLSTKNALLKNRDLAATSFEIGGLYQYVYDPLDESKKTMDAYDMFPLMIPIDTYHSDKNGPGVRGLNLHYLNSRLRFFLFAKLLEIGRISGSDKNKRLILTYKLLKDATKIPEFAPCLHNYLLKNVKSNLISIPVDEWKVAVVLPNANFKKMSEMAVWAESFRKAMQRKI